MSVLSIVEKYDRTVGDLEAAEVKRVNDSMDAAYRKLESELRSSYSGLQSQGSLTVLQRKLLVLDQLQEQLVLIPEFEQNDYEVRLYNTLRVANEQGRTLADELTVARQPNHVLQDFSDIPFDALGAQARDGVRRLYRHTADFASRASAIVEQGLIQGWGAGRVSRLLRNELGTTKSKAETIARTEINSALVAASQSRYKRNGIEYGQWVITPSESVCVFCTARNGNVYPIDQIRYPLHPRDRCMILPWRREWAADGLTEDSVFEDLREKGINDLKARGLTPQYSKPASFEKAAGLTEAPKPFWVPGDAVPKVPRKKKKTPIPPPTQRPEPVQPEPVIIPVAPAPEPDTSTIQTRFSGARRPQNEAELRELGRDRFKQFEAKFNRAATEERSVPPELQKKRDEAFQKLMSSRNDPKVSAALKKRYQQQFIKLDQQVFKAKGSKKNRQSEVMAELQDFLRNRGGPENRKFAMRRAAGVDISERVEEYRKEAIRESIADMMVMTNRQIDVDFITNANARPFFSYNGNTVNVGADTAMGNVGLVKETLYHEIAHSMEYRESKYKLADVDFLRRRATSPDIGPIYDDLGESTNEEGYSDDWVTPYIGRVYEWGDGRPGVRSTEVLSVGMEHFANKNRMYDLYEEDPEHFHLVLGILEDTWLPGEIL